MSTSEQICRQFSLDEIKSATRDLDDELIIGKGGFGSVYIGSINDVAEIVAIKRLSIESTQGETEFLREIETLSKLQHDNLVRLQGYCNESPEKILVYEYMPNGTLVDHLYKIKDSGSTSATGDNQPTRLTWEQRLSICIGAARGLDFLHRGAVPGVIHRDIKGSNILLDGNFGAKIADFGLAKLVKATSDPNITCVSTTIFKGTFGYMDPEYFYTQRLTTKTDVYAFGVVLLVVLSGRPAVDNKAVEDQRSLAEWAKKCIEKNRVDLIIDPYLVGKISPRSLKQFVRVSQRCLRRQSEQRPTMEEVLGALELALKKQPISGLTTRQSNEGSSNFRQMIMAKLQLVSKKKQHDKEKCVPSTSILQLGSFHSLSRIEPWDLVVGYPCPHFSLAEIKAATKNFSNNIGEGGFGSIYLGHLSDGEDIVAIKRFKSKSAFLVEIVILCKLQHDHVVRLKGYCTESSEMILVYEYLAKGSLESHLYKRGDNPHAPLTWEQRLNICIGAARGLDFLHRATDPGFIHRDVNCSNIMLDDNFEPKITDFGLAKLANKGDDAISTDLFGTLGYIAPEYYHTGKMTKKIDVYGFGVVLIVVLSGRRPYRIREFSGDNGNDEMPLCAWAVECIKDNRTGELIDPDLKWQIERKSLKKFLKVAQNCLHKEPENRHTMEDIVAGLELALKKQLSSTSTRWVKSHEQPTKDFMQDVKCALSASVAGYPCPHFSLAEIKAAPKNFRNNIGEGGFGSVYLGHLSDGEDIIAIKRFKSKSAFLGEIAILCKQQHDHVVRLKGYCTESSEMILVYEYLVKGSLESHLYKRGDNPHAHLTWEQRLNICIGAARGLDFLHRATEPGFIHRDVKCSNIMLDDNFVPKITDFGLAKLANYGDHDITTNVRGTVGYIAPEYFTTGKVTKKIDVYGFGVVLLVVLSGRRPYHIRDISGDDGNNAVQLCTLAVECIQDNRIGDLIDPDLRGQFKSESLEKFLEVAQNCLHMVPEKRHTMEDAVAGLELALEKQLSSTSTQWIESHELPNLLYLLSENDDLQEDVEYVDGGESEIGEYSSELYQEFMEEYSDM